MDKKDEMYEYSVIVIGFKGKEKSGTGGSCQ
jgi:hypothetical protein